MNDSPFSVAQQFVGIASLIVILAMARWGRTPERIVAFAFAATMYGTPLVGWIVVEGAPIGVSAISLTLFATMLFLALRVDRWWLLAASGVQLLSICTWGLHHATNDIEVWGGVTVRLIIWVALMAIGSMGVLEARLAPYARES